MSIQDIVALSKPSERRRGAIIGIVSPFTQMCPVPLDFRSSDIGQTQSAEVLGEVVKCSSYSTRTMPRATGSNPTGNNVFES